jgi:predicted Zn-dependent protease
MSAEALHADAEAQTDYQRALAEGPPDMRALDLLAALLARTGKNDELGALSQLPMLSKVAASPSTLLAIAGALNKNGNPKAVARLLEAQIELQPPSMELYGVLADACIASGNTSRANEVRALSANLKR